MMNITTFLVLTALIIFVSWFVRLCYKANVVDWGHSWINFLDGFLRLFIRTYHRFQYQPIPLPDKGGALLVANHVSGLDPLLMIAACRRPVRFLIAQEQYQRFGLHWVFKQVGCIPVQRGARVEKPFRAALQALQQGEVVALFPEGAIHTRRKPAKRLKGGIAKLAEMSGAPVYATRISGILLEGFTVLTLFIPNRARLESYPAIPCAEMGHDQCLAELSGLLIDKRK